MAFGPIMRFTVNGIQVELAPIPKDAAGEFISLEHGGGMQRYSVTKYMGRTLAPQLEDELEWIDKVRLAADRIVWGIWIISGDQRTLIGNSALINIDTGDHAKVIRQATSGSMIFRKEYWGKGIASAAHKARTWYAFQHLGFHRINSAVIQANVGSRTALERSGYAFVYTERNECYIDGQLHHLDHLECLNPLPFFWGQWWHGEQPTDGTKEARRKTRASMSWAHKNVELA